LTLDDMARLSPIEKERISKDFRTVLRALDIGLRPPEPNQFVARIGANTEVSFRVQRRAMTLLEEAEEAGHLIGQNPSGVAAAAIYAAAQEFEESLTQRDVADAAEVSTVTISRQFQKFRD
jgi:transcription initiation factor TFIIB